MDSRFLQHYNQELQFIREMGVEFAKRFPKIAGRLDLGKNESADPYVERLLEGFAFLTARIQLKMDAEFPQFTQHLLEMVYPQYLAPMPSMTIVQFEPDLSGGVTEEGFLLPRNTELRAGQSRKGHARCEYRTAHDVHLWPVRLTSADYLPLGEAGRYASPRQQGLKAGLRLRLETVSGINFSDLEMDTLPLYLQGLGDLPETLYELLLGHALGVVVQPADDRQLWRREIHRRQIAAMGFDDAESLLPWSSRSFSGYRYLQEYFSLPQRFLFVEIQGLQESIRRCEGSSLEIVILLDSSRPALEDLVTADNFLLNCTPAINLFPKRADRIHLSNKSTEHHLVVDRTRPRDYEVYAVTGVTGFGSNTHDEQVFRPFYAADKKLHTGEAYYTVQRRPALEPLEKAGMTQKRHYQGSEVYLSLSDAQSPPYRSDLKQLGVKTLCTNRDLPQYILPGHGKTDFTLEIGAPVNATRCLVGPTDPRSSYPEGEYSWRLINHLSLNYLSLVSEDGHDSAAALREMLSLYGDFSEPSIRRQIEGLLAVQGDQVVRRLPLTGPVAFGRGIEITLNFDEAAFEGAGTFLFSAVLERFFSKYVSINSFTQTVVKTRERGEIMQWPVRTGTRTLM